MPNTSSSKPAALLDNHYQGGGENGAGQEAVHIDLTDGHCRGGQQEGKTRHHLGAIAEGVNHHGGRHHQQQDQVNGLGGDDAGRLHVVHGVGGEVEQGPAAADPGASQNAVGLAFLEPEARAEQRRAYHVTHHHFPRRPQRLQLVGEKKRYAHHQNNNAQLVQPVGAQHFFHAEGAARGIGRRGRARKQRRRGRLECREGRGRNAFRRNPNGNRRRLGRARRQRPFGCSRRRTCCGRNRADHRGRGHRRHSGGLGSDWGGELWNLSSERRSLGARLALLLLESIDSPRQRAPVLVAPANAVSGASGLHEGDDRQDQD